MPRLLALCALLLSGCIAPPDFPVCRELKMKTETKIVDGIGTITLERPNPVCKAKVGDSICGFCVWTISNRAQYVGESKAHHLGDVPWSAVKASAAMVPAREYAKVKEYIINACKRDQDCSKDIDRWRFKLDVFGVPGN